MKELEKYKDFKCEIKSYLSLIIVPIYRWRDRILCGVPHPLKDNCVSRKVSTASGDNGGQVHQAWLDHQQGVTFVTIYSIIAIMYDGCIDSVVYLVRTIMYDDYIGQKLLMIDIERVRNEHKSTRMSPFERATLGEGLPN